MPLRTLCLLMGLLALFPAFAQEVPARWQAEVALGQYPASLVVPRRAPWHPGLRLGLAYQWNQHPRHRLRQSVHLGYFYHQHLQHATQLYTELAYQVVLGMGVHLTPLVLGGGYVLSVTDLPSLAWDPAQQAYRQQGFPARSNWLLSLGSEIGFAPGLKVARRPLTFSLLYRLQVQGIFMRDNIPVMAYAPLMLGFSLPLDQTD